MPLEPLKPLTPLHNLGGKKDSRPDSKVGGINILRPIETILGRGKNPTPEKRASQAIEDEAREHKRRQQAEAEMTRLNQLRSDLKKLADEKLTDAADDPHWQGWSDYIARASKQNPDLIAGMLVEAMNEGTDHNDMAYNIRQALKQRRIAANNLRQELALKPISSFNLDLTKKIKPSQPKEPIFKKLAKNAGKFGLASLSGITNLGVKSLIASLNLDPKIALNSITMDESGIHIRQPLQKYAKVDLPIQNLHDVIITPNPAPWLDKILGIANLIPFVNISAPIGEVTVTDVRGQFEARVAAINPEKLSGQMNRAKVILNIPNQPLPDFRPEPHPQDLLNNIQL